MRILSIAAIIATILMSVLSADASTYSQPVTANFSGVYSGMTSSVYYTVYDHTGTVKIARTNSGVSESLDNSSNGTGIYVATVTLDTSWLPVRIHWDVSGNTGVVADGIVGSSVSSSWSGITVSIKNYPTTAYDGTTTGLTAQVVNSLQGITWSASAGTIDSAGNWTAPSNGSGTATITATSVEDTSRTSSVSISYSPGPSVTLSSSGGTTVAVGSSTTISATVVVPSGTSQPTTYAWSVSPSTGSGLRSSGTTATMTPISSGTYVVKLSLPEINKSATITITVP